MRAACVRPVITRRAHSPGSEVSTGLREANVPWIWVVSAPDRTDGNSSLTLEITVSPGGVECRFHRLGLSYVDSLRLFAREDIVRATAGVGSRLPLDRTVSDLEVGVKPDGRIPANAVCPWDVHPVDVTSGRTMGIIDGIVGLPRRIYMLRPLLA